MLTWKHRISSGWNNQLLGNLKSMFGNCSLRTLTRDLWTRRQNVIRYPLIPKAQITAGKEWQHFVCNEQFWRSSGDSFGAVKVAYIANPLGMILTKNVDMMDACSVATFILYRAGWYTGNAVRVYSRCAWLESRLGRRIPLAKHFFVFFLRSPRKMSE